MPRVYTQTAGYALFLNAYGSGAVPYAYMAQALSVPLAGYLYLAAARRFDLRTLILGTLGADIAVLGLLRVALLVKVPYAPAAGLLWFDVEFVLSSLLLWALANRLMTVRQGKRLFGYVVAGEPVAAIVCGATTPLLLRVVSVADLFLLSAAGAAGAIALTLVIAGRYRLTGAPEEQTTADEPPRPLRYDRYVVTLVGLVVASHLALFFLDNAFYLGAQLRYPSPMEMSAFLGRYSAVVGALSLIASVAVAGPLVRRFGIRGGLLTLPSLLLAGCVAIVVTAHLAGVGAAVFWLLVGNKVIDQSLRYTVDKTSTVTLYQPLPADQRLRLQAVVESFVDPTSAAVAGVLLFVMLDVLRVSIPGIAVALVVVIVAWIALVLAQQRGYLDILRRAIVRRQIDRTALESSGAETIAFARRALASPHPGEVLYSLEVLEAGDAGPSDDELLELLAHGAEPVRVEAARRIARRGTAMSRDGIGLRIAAEPVPAVRGALVAALAACSRDDAFASVVPFLDDADEEVRLHAAVGLLQHGGIEGILAVGERLILARRAPDPATRIFAADVIGRLRSPLFYSPLIPLLEDEEPAVRAAALRAAGAVGATHLWPAMFANLGRPESRREASAAIAAVGEPILATLAASFEDPAADEQRRRALIDAAGKIDAVAASRWLVARLDDAGRRGRRHVLRALRRSSYRPGEQERGMLRRAFREEAETAAWLGAAWRDAAGVPGGEPLRRALEDEIEDAIDAAFSVLACVVDGFDVDEAQGRYRCGVAAQRAYVLEMLDNTVDRELKATLFPLLEPEATAERAARLAHVFPQARRSGDERISELAAECDRIRPWTRATALYASAPRGARIPAGIVRAALDSSEEIVRETAARLAAAGGRKESPMLLTIEKVLILRSVSIFEHVREHNLAYLAASAEDVSLAAGQTLFEAGDFGDALYVIVSGRVRVHIGVQTLAELGERNVVGEMAALDPEPRSASVTALDDSVLLRIGSEKLGLLMADEAGVAQAIIRVLCGRLRGADAVSRPH